MTKTRMTDRRHSLKLALALIAATSFTGLNGCNNSETPAQEQAVVKATSLADMIAHPRRLEADATRDEARNPQETLEFFGLKPDMTVIEIWPSSYYADIIAPYLATTQNDVNGGQYIAAQLPMGIAPYLDKRVKNQQVQYANNDIYGNVSFTTLSGNSLELWPAGDADMVLTFRNVHNWMKAGYAQEAFNSFYKALKPGGILGVVEHRLPESETQDPLGASGYVQSSYMKNLAQQAGFEFVGSSEINANPKDTADHPFGVWTLPPRSRTSKEGIETAEGFDRAKYREIGESDRATLKFRKPL